MYIIFSQTLSKFGYYWISQSDKISLQHILHPDEFNKTETLATYRFV